MKFSTCMAALMVSLACVTTGCRYDKANDGAGEGAEGDAVAMGATDLNAETDISSTDGEMALDNAQGGGIDDLANAGKSFKDRGYKLCTDVAFAPVYFGFDATSIKPEELAKVEAVARHLADNPKRVVTIEGNCDERGSNEYNLSLGDDRAIIIGNFLAQNGITRDRIETVSRGETNPAVAGSGESAWAQNRRGEFIIWER